MFPQEHDGEGEGLLDRNRCSALIERGLPEGEDENRPVVRLLFRAIELAALNHQPVTIHGSTTRRVATWASSHYDLAAFMKGGASSAL